jgi:hypothetical protein
MPKTLYFSENESQIMGLKIGRCNEDFFDPALLSAEIIEGAYDVCRLKVAAEDEMAVMKLHTMGFPYFFSGSIRRYKTRIQEDLPGDFLHPEMRYELYDGTQDELLKEMLIGTWGTYPLGYYRSPFLCHLVNKEIEIESVFQFYKQNNLNSLHPSNSILFMNDRGKHVGFFALNIINGNLESHIGGILEPYRKDGYFLDMLRYIRRFCLEQDLPHFLFGARNENAYVQKIFQEVGFKAMSSENVFHVTPLLAKAEGTLFVVPFTAGLDAYTSIFTAIMDYLSSNHVEYYLKSMHILPLSSINRKTKGILEISFPIPTEEEMYMVIKVRNLSQKLSLIAYASLSRV